MDILNLRKARNIIIHISFWILVWLFFRYFFSYNSEVKSYINWFSALLVPLTMAASYFMIYLLIPKYLLSKQFGRFALYSFYIVVFASYITTLIIYGTLIIFLDFNVLLMPPMSKNFLFIMILIFLVVGMLSSLAILSHNLKTVSRNKELQNKILATQLELKEQELNYLKSQIHPHFLFNTLNTIYGMAIAQSEQTPELILRLSNLLDYILYQVNKPRVSLSEEVLHIEEYIELERVRFKDTLKVNYRYDSIDKNIETAPMLLIPFVENAFKHGSIRDGFLSIDIDIKISGNKLDFKISNSVMSDNESKAEGGIGLGNTRKRLEMQYPDGHKLLYGCRNGYFELRLLIDDLRNIKDVG